jgi:hypothetical protein
MTHHPVARKLAFLAVMMFCALFATAGFQAYAEPIDQAQVLDPFDPVPQIQFHHGDCDWGCRGCIDSCGYRHCWDGCGYHRCCWHRHIVWRCEFGCGPSLGQIFEERVARYDYQADRNDALVHQYEVMAREYADQACWYDWHVRGRVCDPHQFDHHDGPPPGAAIVHDGPPPGGPHDGPPPPH